MGKLVLTEIKAVEELFKRKAAREKNVRNMAEK
ncbi:MAG: hypothetical protein ACJASL_000561 [Paraglaciecola sp.]|jgi:hypothetical protein